MSRRESRVSMNVRQNDALFEFENFKKKFLLANKHITKLNSTLSVRIEELNAQISSLYVENLRLRASEIALEAQLKREREKSRKVMAEAETATLNLTKHLSYLRRSFDINTTSPTPSTPPSPRARKPPPNRIPNPNPTMNSPQVPRLSRPPNVPGICEEDEPCPSSSEHDPEKQPSPALRKTSKPKPRLSASRLPLPARVAEPPPLLPLADSALSSELQQQGSSTKPRRPTRRQSGLLLVNDSLSVPRAPSPAFGSPIRRAAGLAEEQDEQDVAALNEHEQMTLEAEMEVDVELEVHPKKVRRKSKGKERDAEKERESESESVPHPPPRERERERERSKKRERVEDNDHGNGGKPRLKDVTNSRAALLPIDNTVYDQPDEVATTRQFLGSSPTPSQPTSRSSSSPIPPSDGEGGGGRERRTRKSVNYAEPKLNTKMRKPDPPPGTAPLPTKKRSSAAAVLTTYKFSYPEDMGNDADKDTEGARSSLELPPLPLRVNGNAIDPALFPLPQSRPASSMGMGADPEVGTVLFSPPPHVPAGTGSLAKMSMKRKKSRPQIVLDEDAEESEGAQADAEYGYGQGAGWVNVEGRRRGVGGGGAKRSAGVLDEARRHSMAV